MVDAAVCWCKSCEPTLRSLPASLAAARRVRSSFLASFRRQQHCSATTALRYATYRLRAVDLRHAVCIFSAAFCRL